MLIEPKKDVVKINTIRYDIGTCFIFKGEYYVTTERDCGIGIFAFNLNNNSFLFEDDIRWDEDDIELVNLVVVEK